MTMTRPASVSQFRSEFDLFLYASVEEDGNEAHLSVLSALARLDVDPWQEAANLARMSRESATQRLAALIDTLPGTALAHSNCIAVAARLIALLPSQASTRIVTLEAAADGAVPTQMRPIIYLVIINAVFMALTFGGQYLTANSRPAKQAESARAPIGQKSNPQVPLPSADKK